MPERDLNNEIKQIRDDFASLQHDVAGITGLLRNLGEDRLEGVKASAAQRLRAGAEELRQHADTAEARGREAVDELGSAISGHPLGSMAMAFGIGFIVSKLLDLGSRH